MGLNQPYYRICRPFPDRRYLQNIESTYLRDPRYASDMSSFIRAYKLLENDLLQVFEYVEPTDANLATYSHQLYQLFLRACTEVESNATAILTTNGYTKSSNLNITDYFKVEQACRLSEYVVTLPVWSGVKKRRQPFLNWNSTHTLKWYQDYNTVKHNRSSAFQAASFDNVLDAISGTFILLFAQFNIFAFDAYHTVSSHSDEGGKLSYPSCLFQIELPSSWSTLEEYDFDWNTLSSQASPFQPFTF